MDEETVTISLELYNTLLKQAAAFVALETYGVDNWDGYGEAMAQLKEESNGTA